MKKEIHGLIATGLRWRAIGTGGRVELQALDRADEHLAGEHLVRAVLQTHGKLAVPAASIKADDDLYKLGLSSLATVNVMLELESRLDTAIPDEALTRATFQTIAALSALVRSLGHRDGA